MVELAPGGDGAFFRGAPGFSHGSWAQQITVLPAVIPPKCGAKTPGGRAGREKRDISPGFGVSPPRRANSGSGDSWSSARFLRPSEGQKSPRCRQ